MVRKNEWIIKLELKNIRRIKVLQKEEDIEANNSDNTAEWFYQDEENMHTKKVTQVATVNVGEEKKNMIQDILDLNKGINRTELGRFNEIDRCVLTE